MENSTSINGRAIYNTVRPLCTVYTTICSYINIQTYAVDDNTYQTIRNINRVHTWECDYFLVSIIVQFILNQITHLMSKSLKRGTEGPDVHHRYILNSAALATTLLV